MDHTTEQQALRLRAAELVVRRLAARVLRNHPRAFDDLEDPGHASLDPSERAELAALIDELSGRAKPS